jgi:hypothetical protein
MQRYGGSDRVRSLFGGTESLKSAILQLECYIEWNSFLCVESPVHPGIAEYLKKFHPDVSFEFSPTFIAEPLSLVKPMVERLWQMAGNLSLNHVQGFALDSNIAARLVDMGPEGRKELFAGFVLHLETHRAQYCMQQRKFPGIMSWSEGLAAAMQAVKQKRAEKKN